MKGIPVVGTKQEIIQERRALVGQTSEYRKDLVKRWIMFLVERGYYQRIGEQKIRRTAKLNALFQENKILLFATVLMVGRKASDVNEVAGYELANLLFEKEEMHASPKDFVELSMVFQVLIEVHGK